MNFNCYLLINIWPQLITSPPDSHWSWNELVLVSPYTVTLISSQKVSIHSVKLSCTTVYLRDFFITYTLQFNSICFEKNNILRYLWRKGFSNIHRVFNIEYSKHNDDENSYWNRWESLFSQIRCGETFLRYYIIL